LYRPHQDPRHPPQSFFFLLFPFFFLFCVFLPPRFLAEQWRWMALDRLFFFFCIPPPPFTTPFSPSLPSTAAFLPSPFPSFVTFRSLDSSFYVILSFSHPSPPLPQRGPYFSTKKPPLVRIVSLTSGPSPAVAPPTPVRQ